MRGQTTEVLLLAVPLENDYKHTYYFPDRSTQEAFFRTKAVKQELNFSFVRKDEPIRFPAFIDEISNCNYLMYRETNSSKWTYCFITDLKYLNDDTTQIQIETDVIQTYLLDCEVKPSFIEREHVNDDIAGNYTIPEGLEMGEYITTYKSNINDLINTNIVLSLSNLSGQRYNGIYSGVAYNSFYNDEIDSLNNTLKFLDEEGQGEIVQCLFIAPVFLCERKSGDGISHGILTSESAKTIEHSINKSISRPGETNDKYYKPRNKKLNTYPFKYLLVSNNNGGNCVYKYEEFSEEAMKFEVSGVLTPGCSIRLVPKNYKGVSINDEEGLNLGKYPILNWSSDIYTNWLTQNSVNIAVSVATDVAQLAAGAFIAGATGGVGGAIGATQVIAGVSSIAQTMGEVHKASLAPPQTRGNINCGDVIAATNRNTFTFYGMSIKNEYLRIIDSYFDMFGYKVNRVSVPLKNHRPSYWYTKTIDVNIDGNIPNRYLSKIKECYNTGLTFWKHNVSIGDYSVNNNPS